MVGCRGPQSFRRGLPCGLRDEFRTASLADFHAACRVAYQGHCVVGFLVVTRVMAWSGWRAWWRRARAMLVWPASRRRLMIRLRQTARAWGPAPVLAWWR